MVLMIILVAIVVTGIMNTMWIAIRERTREIGTLRAIGMHRRAVARMFLLESLLLGLFGTAAGAVAAAAIAAGINALNIAVPLTVQLFLMSDHLRLDVTPQAAVQAVVMLIAGDRAGGALPVVPGGPAAARRGHVPLRLNETHDRTSGALDVEVT